MTDADHGSRLTRVEAEIGELRRAVDVVLKKLDAWHSAAGMSWQNMLSTIRDCAVLFSLVVAGILYLANATAGRTHTDLETRLTRLEVIIGLATANAKRGAGGVTWH
jgi:predicted nucleic acid-binding protein